MRARKGSLCVLPSVIYKKTLAFWLLITHGFIYAAGSYALDEDDSSQLFFKVNSTSYSDTASIYQIVDGLQGGSIDNGRYAFTHNQVELGASFGRWFISGRSRYDYYLEYAPDTAQVIYRDANNQPLERNRQYQLQISAVHARTKGISVGYSGAITSSLSIGLAVSVLKSDTLLDGSVSGAVSVDNDDYSGNVFIDYVYDEPLFLNLEPLGSPTGQGYTLDVNAEWQLTPTVQLALEWMDVASEIKYDDASFTIATANSNQISFDEDGLIGVKPLVQGRRGGKPHTLRFPKRSKIAIDAQVRERVTLITAWRQHAQIDFYSLGARFAFSPRRNLAFEYDFKSHAARIGFASRSWELALGMDTLVFKDARAIDLQFAYRY